MTRRVVVNGATMCFVKGPAGSAIANLTELGLAQNQIVINFTAKHDDIMADAWGKEPFDIQTMLSSATISMDLIHFDPVVLAEVLRLSAGGPVSAGRLAPAGTLMGGNVAAGLPGNNYIRLNLASPVGQTPWRFYTAYVPGGTPSYPLGSQKSVVQVNWRAIPYTSDPWQGGAGAANFPWFDNVLDT